MERLEDFEDLEDLDDEKITDITKEGEELTFPELYASVVLSGEVIITIPPEEVERVKTGLKNLKAKQASKMKDEGLAPDPSVFTFIERTPLEAEYKDNFIDLSISLSRRGTIKIAKIRVPDGEF